MQQRTLNTAYKFNYNENRTGLEGSPLKGYDGQTCVVTDLILDEEEESANIQFTDGYQDSVPVKELEMLTPKVPEAKILEEKIRHFLEISKQLYDAGWTMTPEAPQHFTIEDFPWSSFNIHDGWTEGIKDDKEALEFIQKFAFSS